MIPEGVSLAQRVNKGTVNTLGASENTFRVSRRLTGERSGSISLLVNGRGKLEGTEKEAEL